MTALAHELHETTVDGHDALVLVSPASLIEATIVPGAGMICSSLRHDGRELLHIGEGLPAYVERAATFGVPLLHPWANRLERLSYEAVGAHVLLDPARTPVHVDGNGLSIHGLLHATSGWKVERTRADGGGASVAARLDFGADPHLLAGFPFPHTLELVIALQRDVIAWELTLVAGPDRAVPVSFGWHPYLTLPGIPREEWQLELPVVRRAMLDARGIPTGQTAPAGFRSGALGDRAFDDLFPLLDEPAEFVLAGGDGALRLRFDEGWACAQVYTPPGADFICFEPMTAPTDALRRGGASLHLVSPGERHTGRWSLLVEGRPGA